VVIVVSVMVIGDVSLMITRAGVRVLSREQAATSSVRVLDPRMHVWSEAKRPPGLRRRNVRTERYLLSLFIRSCEHNADPRERREANVQTTKSISLAQFFPM
jgi:hypothetical protein